jgi:Zn finger protein HypA/HybF involved in hydrogenase expression
MGVQTIGEAYQAEWRIHVRCAWCRREGMKKRARLSRKGRAGPAHADLDEGQRLPDQEARLKCPMCGSRKVSVIFDVPSEPAAMQIAGMPSG